MPRTLVDSRTTVADDSLFQNQCQLTADNDSLDCVIESAFEIWLVDDDDDVGDDTFEDDKDLDELDDDDELEEEEFDDEEVEEEDLDDDFDDLDDDDDDKSDFDDDL